jgi:hypothetical protein
VCVCVVVVAVGGGGRAVHATRPFTPEQKWNANDSNNILQRPLVVIPHVSHHRTVKVHITITRTPAQNATQRTIGRMCFGMSPVTVVPWLV